MLVEPVWVAEGDIGPKSAGFGQACSALVSSVLYTATLEYDVV